MSEFEKYLQAASKAALAAGQLIRERVGSAKLHHTKVNQRDLVTDVDLASQSLIENILCDSFPEIPILGEESVSHAAVGDAPTWIVDPLDGTTNFSRGNDLFSVAIALSIDRRPVVGVVYQPLTGAHFASVTEHGATKNDAALTVSKTQELSDFIVGSTQAYETDKLQLIMNRLSDLVPHVGGFRLLTSTELQLATVATGEIDAMICDGSSPWDIAAGALLVQESGGVVTNRDGEPWTVADHWCLASNGVHHEHLQRLLTATRR